MYLFYLSKNIRRFVTKQRIHFRFLFFMNGLVEIVMEIAMAFTKF